MAKPKQYNMNTWVEENKQFFLPPVCNKMMHGESQMKCFFVGGPNVRKDYHIEEGPEFFYMVKGDMVLKVVEQDKHRDIVIKEGQVFMLPPRIPHSPQRQADTVGLVIERARVENEMDGLRYFVEKDGQPTSEILHETWFHCTDLGPQLAAIINKYFETEQYKTGVPNPDTILSYDEAPVKVDRETKLMEPFSLDDFLEDNELEIVKGSSIDLFKGSFPGAKVEIMGGGGAIMTTYPDSEAIFWVLEGYCDVTVNNKKYVLDTMDTLWLPVNTQFYLSVGGTDSRVLMLTMEPPSA